MCRLRLLLNVNVFPYDYKPNERSMERDRGRENDVD